MTTGAPLFLISARPGGPGSAERVEVEGQVERAPEPLRDDHGGAHSRARGELEADAERKREHPLAHGRVGQHVVDEVRSGVADRNSKRMTSARGGRRRPREGGSPRLVDPSSGAAERPATQRSRSTEPTSHVNGTAQACPLPSIALARARALGLSQPFVDVAVRTCGGIKFIETLPDGIPRIFAKDDPVFCASIFVVDHHIYIARNG